METSTFTLLDKVQQLADEPRAQKPISQPPKRISVRERTAAAIAAQEAEEQDREERHRANRERRSRLPPKRRTRPYTRDEADKHFYALVEQAENADKKLTYRKVGNDGEEREEEYLRQNRAGQVNERMRRLWGLHAEEIRATTPRYVDGLPVRDVMRPPRYHPLRARGTGDWLAEEDPCKRCSGLGLRCVRKGDGDGDCSRCERAGEACEEDGDVRRENRKLDVVGSVVEEVDAGRFALPMGDGGRERLRRVG